MTFERDVHVRPDQVIPAFDDSLKFPAEPYFGKTSFVARAIKLPEVVANDWELKAANMSPNRLSSNQIDSIRMYMETCNWAGVVPFRAEGIRWENGRFEEIGERLRGKFGVPRHSKDQQEMLKWMDDASITASLKGGTPHLFFVEFADQRIPEGIREFRNNVLPQLTRVGLYEPRSAEWIFIRFEQASLVFGMDPNPTFRLEVTDSINFDEGAELENWFGRFEDKYH